MNGPDFTIPILSHQNLNSYFVSEVGANKFTKDIYTLIFFFDKIII